MFIFGACVNVPPSGNTFSQEMDRIDETYKASPNDSEEVRRNKEYFAGNARVEAMKSRENNRVFKNTVLRTTLSERFCPEWRPYFALEAIECKATYDYTLFLKLSCENKNQKLSLNSQIKWQIANQEGYVNANKMDSVAVRFFLKRTVKHIDGPPLEDPEMPSTFDIVISGTRIKLKSNQNADVPVVVPKEVCQ